MSLFDELRNPLQEQRAFDILSQVVISAGGVTRERLEVASGRQDVGPYQSPAWTNLFSISQTAINSWVTALPKSGPLLANLNVTGPEGVTLLSCSISLSYTPDYKAKNGVAVSCRLNLTPWITNGFIRDEIGGVDLTKKLDKSGMPFYPRDTRALLSQVRDFDFLWSGGALIQLDHNEPHPRTLPHALFHRLMAHAKAQAVRLGAATGQSLLESYPSGPQDDLDIVAWIFEQGEDNAASLGAKTGSSVPGSDISYEIVRPAKDALTELDSLILSGFLHHKQFLGW
jgi:hypothetical protein